MKSGFLFSVIKQFEYYKLLAEKTFDQLPDEALHWQYNTESNSIATIVKHLSGNMQSRWTDIFNTDGEKEWRNRETEFDNDILSRNEMLEYWNKGWTLFFETLNSLHADDMDKIIYIRNQGHTVSDAITRQLAHYPYHIGQIVYIGKLIANTNWKSLSIARGASDQYNTLKFNAPKQITHFTDEYLPTKENK